MERFASSIAVGDRSYKKPNNEALRLIDTPV